MKRLLIGAVAALTIALTLSTPAGASPRFDDGICWDVSAADVAAIDRGFLLGEHVDPDGQVDGRPTGSTYIVGDIMVGGQTVAEDEVWIELNGVMYAVTDQARERSVLLDGRHYLDADKGADMLEYCTGF